MLKILGHRGTKEDFYENSDQAFLEALDCCDGLETDAVRTKDGKVFLVHDTIFIEKVEYELSRHLCEESQKIIGTQRLDQIDEVDALQLKLKNGEPLANLQNLLTHASKYPGTILNLELKGEDVAKAVVQTVQDAVDMGQITKEQIIISSFNHGQLAEVRKLDPEIKIGILFSLEDQPYHQQLHPWSEKDKGCYIPFHTAYLDSDVVRDIKPDFINVDEGIVRPEVIAEIAKRLPDAKFMIWYLKEPKAEENTSLLAKLKNPDILRHIHSVITNNPRRMVAFLQQENILPA